MSVVQSQALTLSWASSWLRVTFCTAEHQVPPLLGAQGCLLTSFGTEKTRHEATVGLVFRRGNQSCRIQLITVVTCSPGAEPRHEQGRGKVGGCSRGAAAGLPRASSGHIPQTQPGGTHRAELVCSDNRAAVCPVSLGSPFLSAVSTEELLPSRGGQPCRHPGHRVQGRTGTKVRNCPGVMGKKGRAPSWEWRSLG